MSELRVEKAETKPSKEELEKHLESLKSELSDLQSEIEKKEYLVNGGESFGLTVKMYLEDEAKWTAQESLGVVRAHEDLMTAIQNIKKGKTKELMLSNLCIEAISYFLSKRDGVGLESAKKFSEIYGAFNEALSNVRTDSQRIEALKQRVEFATQSVEHGVDAEK